MQTWPPHSANFFPFSNQQIAITPTTSHSHPICLPRRFLTVTGSLTSKVIMDFTLRQKRNLEMEVIKIWTLTLIREEWSQRVWSGK